MAVKMRLKRMGKKRHPIYRIVVADSRSPRDGRFIEEIGTYDPNQEPSVFDVNEEAAKKAQQYLNVSAFSRSGLIDQLKFEGFTDEQAEYGAAAVGY